MYCIVAARWFGLSSGPSSSKVQTRDWSYCRRRWVHCTPSYGGSGAWRSSYSSYSQPSEEVGARATMESLGANGHCHVARGRPLVLVSNMTGGGESATLYTPMIRIRQQANQFTDGCLTSDIFLRSAQAKRRFPQHACRRQRPSQCKVGTPRASESGSGEEGLPL